MVILKIIQFFQYLNSQCPEIPLFYTLPFPVYYPAQKNCEETDGQLSPSISEVKAEVPRIQEEEFDVEERSTMKHSCEVEEKLKQKKKLKEKSHQE